MNNVNNQIITKMELITPEKAAKLLQTNTLNRRIMHKTVAHYANQMMKGHWTISGQTISISDKGNLLDGQHRLQAIIKSGKSISFLVAYNVPEDSFMNYDHLRPRTVSNTLAIMGVKNSSEIVSGIKFFQTLSIKKANKVLYDTPNQQKHSIFATNSVEKFKLMDNIEVVEFYENNEKICQEVATAGRRYYKKLTLFSVSQNIGLMLYLILKKHHSKEKVLSFFEQLYYNEHVENVSIYHLREALIANIARTKMITPEMKMIYLIKCWNAFLDGKIIKRFSIQPNDDLIEFL